MACGPLSWAHCGSKVTCDNALEQVVPSLNSPSLWARIQERLQHSAQRSQAVGGDKLVVSDDVRAKLEKLEDKYDKLAEEFRTAKLVKAKEDLERALREQNLRLTWKSTSTTTT